MTEGQHHRYRALTRRRVLTASTRIGIGLAGVTFLGCGSSAERAVPGTLTPAVAPRRGGVITRTTSTTYRGTGFDPMVNNSAALARGLRLFYQGLLGYHFRTYELEPELARNGEQPSETEYIFRLQPGVKWHDKPPANGRALSVDDVVFGLERARTNDPSFQSRSYLISVDKIEAVDASTLRMTAKWPDASFLIKLAADSVMVLAPEVVEKAGGKFATADTAVGTGPFILTSYEHEVAVRFVRNPAYWKPGLPYLDEVRMRYFADELTEWAAFLAGELDIADVPPAELKRYIARRGKDFTPDWYYPDTATQSVPNTLMKPMDDPRVTRALRLLHDHEEFIQAVVDGYGVNGSIFPAAFQLAGWDLTHQDYYAYLEWKQPKDEAAREALALLAAAGYTRENPLRFELSGETMPNRSNPAELLQAQWRRLSQGVVQAELRLYDRPVAARRWTERSFTYSLIGLSAGLVDVDAVLSLIYRTGGARNFAGLSDPKLDTMIDRQRGLFNVQERKAFVREIILYMMDVSPYTTPYHPLWLNATTPRLRDYTPERHIQGRQYERLWLDT